MPEAGLWARGVTEARMTEEEFMALETGDAEGLPYAWKRYAVSLGELDPNHPIVRKMIENGDIEPARGAA